MLGGDGKQVKEAQRGEGMRQEGMPGRQEEYLESMSDKKSYVN